MATETRTVDLCFVMDCTGSMSSYITACKNDINVTISRIVAEHPGTVINLGFVAYRDHCDGSNRIQKFGFDANVPRFQSFVGSLQATGGGDYPEDVLGGIWESATMAWSAPIRVLFHIFDAPPHGCPKYHDEGGDSYPNGHPNDKSLEVILGTLRDNFVDYYLLKLTNNLEKMVRVFLDAARGIGYDHIEERIGVGEVSKVMEDVGTAVLDSMAVRVSTKSRPHARLDALIQPRAMSNTYKVYCGIDFGTHGSAFAFCSPGDPVVRAENSWGGNSVDVKTLTNLLLGPNKKCVPGRHGFGHAAQEFYLDMDPADQKSHFFFRRFKMALYEQAIANREDGVDIEGRITATNGKRVKSEIVLVEALKFMVNHVMGQIREQYDDVSDAGDVQWILTVPAIWSQKSRKVMERAAYAAGIPRGKHDQLIVALEPECASVVVQDVLHLPEGKCYMMVDCGGGTVDVACHEVINGGTEVREIWKATGGAWGATYIDDEFLLFLEQVFGDEVMAAVEEEMKEDAPALLENILASFNSAKVMALPTEDKRNVNLGMLKKILVDVIGSVEEINAHLATAEYRGHVGGMNFKSRGVLTLSRDIWDELFGVVINPLVEHLKGLFAEPELAGRMETLCVVGGFAQSPILMDRLQREFGEACRVMRPPNPMLTVVKGASKFGLMPTTIASRKAPKTVGIAIRDVWKETDDETHRKWVRGFGWMVDGVFFPFVRAGQSIPRDMAAVVHYFEPVSADHFQIEIYQCDDENPRFVPDRPSGVIGPVTFPAGFDHQVHDICVQIDFSGRVVTVKVMFGDDVNNNIDVDIEWE